MATGLVDGAEYYIVYKSATKFSVAHTPGAAAITISGTGNNNQFFYKVAKSKYNGAYDTNREKYIGKFYTFKEPTAASNTKLTYQAQLNGAYFPQMAATAEEMYNISKNSIVGSKPYSDLTVEQYKNNHFVQCLRLNMPDSEYSRTMSGLDTRSVSLNGYLLTNNLTTNSADQPNLMIFAECTSTLRVGAGRQLEVII